MFTTTKNPFRQSQNGKSPFKERSEKHETWYDQYATKLIRVLKTPYFSPSKRALRQGKRLLDQIEHHRIALSTLDDSALLAQLPELSKQNRKMGFTPQVVAHCFAIIDEAAYRCKGIRYYPCQFIAGWCMLNGQLVEMATGEGKTLAATLPSATVALTGYPVHVVTVNDYLAKRDAEEMSVLYEWLGLSVGYVIAGLSPTERRAAYHCDITYCANKELTFDYLKDAVVLREQTSPTHLSLEEVSSVQSRSQQLLLRGLYFAIVDEADSVFIDEARTPLILSASESTDSVNYDLMLALDIANALEQHTDFLINTTYRSIQLTPSGIEKLEEQLVGLTNLNPIWDMKNEREALVVQALSAFWLYTLDEDYVIQDDKVQIVDESTGRILADRTWERGLHQLIEMKEGCTPSASRRTLARMTYQRFFSRYLVLSGMTGTAKEISAELRQTYNLESVTIPLHRPTQRRCIGAHLHKNQAEKLQHILTSVGQQTEQGRPVLIGTRSVKSSEAISELLHAHHITHELLNARQDSEEAQIIMLAGMPQQVTVATNMAGRGTDILLAPSVVACGGLHVILTEYHESPRIDRQLFGRCARQGDPGTYEIIVAVDDDLFQRMAPLASKAIQKFINPHTPLTDGIHLGLKWLAQKRAALQHRKQRHLTLQQDQRLQQLLAFTGTGE